jgi:hypothetical protein
MTGQTTGAVDLADDGGGHLDLVGLGALDAEGGGERTVVAVNADADLDRSVR